ncbi:MAG: ATP-binding protein [Alphaproteobacteria bacterium]
MKLIFPRSLFGQTLLILLAGLVISHLIGGWIYTSDREQAVRAVGGLAMAQRIVNVAHLIEDAPMAWRDRIVAQSNDPTFRVSILTAPPTFTEGAERRPISQAIKDFIVDRLSEGAARQVRVAASGTSTPSAAMLDHPMAMGMMMHATGSWRGLQVAIELVPGREWLSVTTTLPDTGPALSWQFILSMTTMALIVVIVSIWAVRRMTVPLRALARAAERLGKDIKSPPVDVLGTVEMRAAARAFNEMQDRLRRLIENRTRMLAAISHDLRTPLTLLRLRVESVENEDEREKMLATISTMNALIDASLTFARDESAAEPRRAVDLTALVASIVDDMADAGFAVAMEPAAQAIYECQPVSLKRAITNLLDNAVRYGKKAHASLRTMPDAIEITIDDEGPGIPEEELELVSEPFYRLDHARNIETGGIGLGLAITHAIAEAHGGGLTLANRREGGLRAVIKLPR